MTIFKYPTVDEIIAKHDKIIDESGGSHGVLNLGALESVIEFIQHDWYYPTFFDKAAHLIYSINKNHAFADGNKRASLMAGAMFMLENGWENDAVDWYLKEFEDIVVWIAEDKLSKENLRNALNFTFVRFNHELVSKEELHNVKGMLEKMVITSKLLEQKLAELGISDGKDELNNLLMQSKLIERILLSAF